MREGRREDWESRGGLKVVDIFCRYPRGIGGFNCAYRPVARLGLLVIDNFNVGLILSLSVLPPSYTLYRKEDLGALHERVGRLSGEDRA